MDKLAQELTSITPDALMSSEGEDLADQAPTFTSFYEQLRSLLGDNVSQETELVLPTEQLPPASTEPPGPPGMPSSPSSPSTSKKRPNSLTITTSSSTKVRPQSVSENNIPRTPDQPTIPKNPGHSGDSIESIAEINTRD